MNSIYIMTRGQLSLGKVIEGLMKRRILSVESEIIQAKYLHKEFQKALFYRSEYIKREKKKIAVNIFQKLKEYLISVSSTVMKDT